MNFELSAVYQMDIRVRQHRWMVCFAMLFSWEEGWWVKEPRYPKGKLKPVS